MQTSLYNKNRPVSRWNDPHAKAPPNSSGESLQLHARQLQVNPFFRFTQLWGRRTSTLTCLPIYSILFGVGCLIYANYFYLTYIIGNFAKYPEPVAEKLRRALYYDNIDPKPDKALRYYKEALLRAEEVGMDPWGAEVMGVRFRVTDLLERHGNAVLAAQILERIRKDCLNWVELEGEKHMEDGERTRILGKTVAMGVKLGELYSGPYIRDREAAEAALISAVETVLREKQRREREGVREGEGEWISDEEAGGSFETLAHHYEQDGKYYLATPLFLHALALCPPKSCHTVVLMNNVAMSLAQQRPPPEMVAPGQRLPTAATLRQQAELWADKALALGYGIQGRERTEECDTACSVALYNLGELAEMGGELGRAYQQYERAKAFSKQKGFGEGVQRAQDALERVDKKRKELGNGSEADAKRPPQAHV